MSLFATTQKSRVSDLPHWHYQFNSEFQQALSCFFCGVTSTPWSIWLKSCLELFITDNCAFHKLYVRTEHSDHVWSISYLEFNAKSSVILKLEKKIIKATYLFSNWSYWGQYCHQWFWVSHWLDTEAGVSLFWFS